MIVTVHLATVGEEIGLFMCPPMPHDSEMVNDFTKGPSRLISVLCESTCSIYVKSLSSRLLMVETMVTAAPWCE